MKEQTFRGKKVMVDDSRGLELSTIRGNVTVTIYSECLRTSQWFFPKIWIKWRGKERKIKLKTLLGDTICVTEDNLRKMNLKMIKIKWGGKYIKLMAYNRPRRQANRIPLLAISKGLCKKIGALSINVEKEYEERARKYPGWTGEATT